MDLKVFTQFRAPVASHPLGIQDVGILTPGRYSGFDIITGTTLSILLKHSGRVKKSSPSIGGVITETTFGSILMPNGCRVQAESTGLNDGIVLNLDTNIGNAKTRYDLVVCEHEFIQVKNGQPPIFFIQKGANDGTTPVLASPKKQVIVGIIAIAPNGNSFINMTYTKSPVPYLGDNNVTEILKNLGILDLIEAKASKLELAALDTRVDVLEADTRVTSIAADVANLEEVVIPAIDARVTELENDVTVVLKAALIELTPWAKNKKYTMLHNIPADHNGILSMTPHLVCVSPEAGYALGDITPMIGSGEDQDGSNDYDYGISVQFNEIGSTEVTIMVGDRIRVRNGKYDVAIDSNTTDITPAKWKIRLVAMYY